MIHKTYDDIPIVPPVYKTSTFDSFLKSSWKGFSKAARKNTSLKEDWILGVFTKTAWTHEGPGYAVIVYWHFLWALNIIIARVAWLLQRMNFFNYESEYHQ